MRLSGGTLAWNALLGTTPQFCRIPFSPMVFLSDWLNTAVCLSA